LLENVLNKFTKSSDDLKSQHPMIRQTKNCIHCAERDFTKQQKNPKASSAAQCCMEWSSSQRCQLQVTTII